jgi:hypothetical protein
MPRVCNNVAFLGYPDTVFGRSRTRPTSGISTSIGNAAKMVIKPVRLSPDRDSQMERVLANLVQNAIKYSTVGTAIVILPRITDDDESELVLQGVGGGQYGAESDYVWTYVQRIRRKIDPDRGPRSPRYVLTEPGVSYRMPTPEAVLLA